MALPYESSTSGERALGEINKILRGLGCNKIGSMVDDGEGTVLVQFEYRGRQCSVKASMRGYASAYLKQFEGKRSTAEQTASRKKKAIDIASVAVYSILRDWIKGQIMAIETGILSFDQAFMGQILLPSGKTVYEYMMKEKALPALEELKP
jgi:hypothetical protein